MSEIRAQGYPVERLALWFHLKVSLELEIRNEKCEMVARRQILRLSSHCSAFT